MSKILTFDGNIANREDCRLIKDEFYIVGKTTKQNSGQCYQIGEEYFLISSGKIGWDYELNRYNLLSNMTYGIVGTRGLVKNLELLYGYFTPNIYENVFVMVEGRQKVAIDKQRISKYGKEKLQSSFIHNKPGSRNYPTIKNIQKITRDIKVDGARPPKPKLYSEVFENTYNIEDDKGVFNFVEAAFQKHLPKIQNTLGKYEKYLYNYSLGIEYETLYGKLPMNMLFKYGLVPLRDGSISGFEYTTVPYRGTNKKLSVIAESCTEMAKRTGVNELCSLHIHYGNVRKDKLYVIALYMLCYQLQHELHEIVPPFKKDHRYLRQKDKDHCQYLRSLGLFDNTIFKSSKNEDFKEKVSANYDEIFTFLNEGNKASVRYNSKNKQHVRTGQNKWNLRTRYYFVNFLNLLFSKRGTVEFRLHHGTVNKYKTVYWALLNSFILKYAENNIKGIINKEFKISLKDIITEMCDDTELQTCLLDYIAERKKEFTTLYFNGELGDMREFIDDSVYVHEPGRKLGI